MTGDRRPLVSYRSLVVRGLATFVVAVVAAYLLGPASPIPHAWYAAPVVIAGFPIYYIVRTIQIAKA